MSRLTLALLPFLCLLSPAQAMLSRSAWQPPSIGQRFPAEPVRTLPTQAVQSAAANPEFVMTDRTEVLVDGRPCKYEKVPRNAAVVNLEVAADKKTILRIHFRTKP